MMIYWNGLGIFLATFCVLPIAIFGQTPVTTSSTPAPIGKLIDVGGYRVHLYCTGTGSPTAVIVGAGFSFDWGLVQPEVAKFTQVCSYDHSGIGWSDPGPKDSCSLRVNEVHAALKKAGIQGPYVLVGHSLGALVARLYASRYPDEVAGIVFVDHAFSLLRVNSQRPPLGDAKDLQPPAPAPPFPSQPPLKPGSGGVALGLESDPNFSRLSARDRELHMWAISQPQDQTALQTRETSRGCTEEAEATAGDRPHPLGDKPLIDISTDLGARILEYAQLQTKLLALSQNSKQIVAENSGHFVIIDRPDVVIDAISQIVQSIRNNIKLGQTPLSGR
jgi:pimeloyl-ACP methyl ester carboxylesterase